MLDQVILSIAFENKEGKYYICMDRQDYSIYLDEKEVLLQAGLKGKLISVQVMIEGGDEITIFNLYISDASVKSELRKRTMDFALPVLIYCV